MGDTRAVCALLLPAVEAVGGYVGGYNEVVDGLGRRSVVLQIRIPADQFDATLGQLDPLGKPFFPLSTCRQSWIIRRGAIAGLPPARFAAFGPNGIIPAQSLRCGLSSPANCSGSCLTVPSAGPAGAANPRHPRLLLRRKSAGANGWALFAMPLPATPPC